MATKYAHLPALVDESGVMVGYVDANHKERDLQGNLVPPGTTPIPGVGSVAWDDVSDKPVSFPTESTMITDASADTRQFLRASTFGTARSLLGAAAVGATVPSASAASGNAGSSAQAARADHVHPYPAQLATARSFSATGDVTAAAVTFNGTGNVALVTSIGSGVVVDADINASAAIALSKLANVAAGTDGLAAGTIQATLQALATRIAALEP